MQILLKVYHIGVEDVRNKKDLNDVTAAPFSVSFSQLPACCFFAAAAKKTLKMGQLSPH